MNPADFYMDALAIDVFNETANRTRNYVNEIYDKKKV